MTADSADGNGGVRKRYFAGTHRCRTPEETLDAYMPLLSRFQVTRLANITGLDSLCVPVYLAVRPNAKGLSVSQGKGLTAAAAKASAMMESIECWHGENIRKPLRHGSVADMQSCGLRVCDVERLPRRRGGRGRRDLAMFWIEGYDIIGEEHCWVPWETVSTNFVVSPHHLATFSMSTNGLASGNSLLEATCHGLCEVIERDAIRRWMSQGGSDGRVNEDAVDPASRAILDRLASRGVHTLLWDATSEAGVPTFAATIFDGIEQHRARTVGMFSGYGCHLSPSVAVTRAITEAAQSRLTMISGSRDDLLHDDYRNCRNEDDLARLMDLWGKRPGLTELPHDLATPTFEGDIARVLDALRSIAIESAIVVDLTHEDIGIPVVKVVVPGLESMVPGRIGDPGERAAARSR